MRNLNVKNQNGRSMIEMLGVLAIIGVLSVGGIAGYSKAMMKYRINKTIEQIAYISTNIRTFYASQGNYNDVDNLNDEQHRNIFKKAKLVPDEMLENWDNPFEGAVEIQNMSKTEAEIDSADRHAFYILYYDLPREACIELATLDWGSAAGAGLMSITASNGGWSLPDSTLGCNGGNTTSATTACSGGSIISIPMPIDQAVAACNCPENTCFISWSYY
ncbi:MAG: hypothetical protein IJ525_02830 [Alphaproteobacteria bacterium]|nr:hypothetical protein [Alphaproteobacteria bacterium]